MEINQARFTPHSAFPEKTSPIDAPLAVDRGESDGVRYRVDMQGWRAPRRASGDDVMEDALTCWNTATYNCTLEQKGYKMAIHSGVQPEVLRSYGERI